MSHRLYGSRPKEGRRPVEGIFLTPWRWGNNWKWKECRYPYQEYFHQWQSRYFEWKYWYFFLMFWKFPRALQLIYAFQYKTHTPWQISHLENLQFERVIGKSIEIEYYITKFLVSWAGKLRKSSLITLYRSCYVTMRCRAQAQQTSKRSLGIPRDAGFPIRHQSGRVGARCRFVGHRFPSIKKRKNAERWRSEVRRLHLSDWSTPDDPI